MPAPAQDKTKNIKLGVAIAAFILGGIGIAYSLGVFEGKSKPGTGTSGADAAPVVQTPPPPPEVQAEIDADLKASEEGAKAIGPTGS